MDKLLILFIMLRPRQWVKNLIMFFPVFLSGSLRSPLCSLYEAIVSLISFCCISSALYVFNDLHDMRQDALHPQKSLRPLPSGKIRGALAKQLSFVMILSGFILAYFVVKPLLVYLLLYCIISASYTTYLKMIPALDIFCISSLFLLRLQAGGAICKIIVSEWLFLSVFFLSLFLSAGKRLSEQTVLAGNASSHRISLAGYPPGALEAILHITSAIVLVTYTMYTLVNPHLVYTVPLCTLGLFRYIIRIKNGLNGDPTESLFHDIPLLFISILWALLVGWSIYL